MKYVFLVLILFGVCSAQGEPSLAIGPAVNFGSEEDLAWMIGHEVTVAMPDATFGHGMGRIDGYVLNVKGVFVEIALTDSWFSGTKWIQSNWIWSIDEV